MPTTEPRRVRADEYASHQAMSEPQQAALYYENRRCAPQWRDFLGALAEEFEGQLKTPQLRELLRNIGERFGRRHALVECHTLDDLEVAINSVWDELDWGCVQIDDAGDYLAVRHLCAPLRAAFGSPAMNWVPAYLEGVYQQWFNTLGVDPALRIREVPSDVEGALEFRLQR
jgi:hypothetical protein